MQVQGALDRIARGVLLEQGSSDNETRPMKLGAPPPPAAAEPGTTRLRAQAPVAQAEPPTRPFRPRATLPPPSRPGPRPPRR